MTWAYFSVSATWNWVQPASEKAWASERASSGGKATCDRQVGLVLGHGHDQQVGRGGATGWRAAVEAVEGGAIGESVDQLPGAVGPEVGMDDRLAWLDRVMVPGDDRRADELVGLAAAVRGLDRGGRRLGVFGGLAVDDGVIAGFDSLPAVIPIHRVVAPTDARDPGSRMRIRETSLEIGDVAESRRRWRIAPVQQRVDKDPRDALAVGQVGQRHEMAIVGVDAARSDEADHAQDAPRLARSGTGREEGGTFEERAVGDGRIDPRQVLEDRATRAEVEMSDL